MVGERFKLGPPRMYGGQEAAEYLRAYPEMRHNGSKTSKIPPENIHDETPLIRNHQTKPAIPLTPSAIHRLVHDDLFRALVVTKSFLFQA
jgi:hypothetical protein